VQPVFKAQLCCLQAITWAVIDQFVGFCERNNVGVVQQTKLQ